MANLNKIKKIHIIERQQQQKSGITIYEKIKQFRDGLESNFFRMFARLIKNNKSIPEKEQHSGWRKFLYLCANVKN